MKRYFSVACLSAIVLVFGIPSITQAQTTSEPELPRIYLSTPYPATGGTIRTVAAGGDLQAALNLAQPGDTIVLQAGAVFVGNFQLPARTGSDWIIIRTSNTDGIAPEGTRVSPSEVAAMAKIVTPNAAPAIATVAGAHHYRLVGLEIGVAPAVSINYGIVNLGDGSAAQNSLAMVPHDLVIDRCYIHGNTTGDVSRGVALNSASTAVIDSYISECHGLGFDTQAIGGWNGPGPFKIVNNYLEAAGENIMFGGADPKIANLVPSDIEFRRNFCSRPLTWNPYNPGYAGVHWSVKNIFELKNAQRVLVDGNVFENNWIDGQAGVAILFTPRNQEGTAPWSVVQDVTFTNNIVRNSAAGVHFLGRDYNYPSQQARRFRIRNNLFYNIGGPQWGGSGRLFLIIDGPADIQIDHNTAFQTGNIVTADGGQSTGFVYTNNITPNNEYGVIGSGHAPGNDSLNYYFPACIFVKNVIIAGPSSIYPSGNFFPASVSDVGFVDPASSNYSLLLTSPYKNAGTDGQDIGASQEMIAAAIGGQTLPAQPPSNYPPQVSIAASAVSGVAPLLINFTASASDPDGSIVSYKWDFGDGQSASGASVSHTYQSAGAFTARVTVIDDSGAYATDSVSITVTESLLPPGSEIVLYASQAPVKAGNWKVVEDATAAGGARLSNPDAGAAKILTPLANPADYFEMRFNAVAGRAYRLWIRGKAQNDSPYNDSVFAQFSGSTDSSGAPVFRIGTTDATTINLEDGLGAGLKGWGWQDNGWGVGVMGPLIYFSTTGPQTIRVQVREDGLSIDQIVLSPQTYLTASPGALKYDTTILPMTSSAPPSITSIAPSSGAVTGGTLITINGMGFMPGAGVTLGGVAAASVTVVSSTSITAITPAHTEGTVDVAVTNTDGSGCVLTGFTYMNPVNQPPQVSIAASAVSGVAPLLINFTASASDPDGSIVSYKWDFGDGQSASGASVSHTYQSAGAFTARVAVTDNSGATVVASISVTVSAAANTVVRVTYPNGGETLLIASTCNIIWSASGANIVRQDIDLSLDGGSTWQKVASGLGGAVRSYSWKVPKSPSRSARIRVRAWDDREMVGEDMSDNSFSISTKIRR